MNSKITQRLERLEQAMAAENRPPFEMMIVFVDPETGAEKRKLLSELNREAAEEAEQRRKSAESSGIGAEDVDDSRPH
jgi:hypothetical protein